MIRKIKELAHIGTTEYIDLPDDGVFGIPAKIDTGADYSAIWASDIVADGGILRFNLFAPGSSYYQSTPVETSAFRIAHVRNSFGDGEFRYKIKLRVKIGGHKLTRWFNLADRSRSTYPVLLGKNFLKNVFVVDVSKRYVASDSSSPKRVLVLGASRSVDFFNEVGEATSSRAEFVCISYRQLTFTMGGQGTVVTNLADNGADIAEYGLVYFKSHNQAPERAAAAAAYLRFRGCRFYDKEVGNYTSASKLTEYMQLSCGGIDVPRTFGATTSYLRSHYGQIASLVGSPFVLKEVKSDRGKNNYLISDQADLEKVLSDVPESHFYVAQTYVANDGFFRLYVVGGKVSLVVWRSTHPHDDRLKAHLNKPFGGANAEKIELKDVPSEASKLAVQAAVCMDRQIAGVDIVQDKKTKKWYVLEVNNAPQIRSGSHLPEKTEMMAELIDRELNR